LKTCLLQTHSGDNEALYRLTLPNHAEYCGRHGYDMWQLNIPYQTVMSIPHLLVARALVNYDVVFAVGSDVIFTDLSKPLSTFFHGEEGVVVSLEDIGGSPTNADTLLFRNGAAYRAVMDHVNDEQETWSRDPWGWQSWFNRQLVTPTVPGAIRFAALRELQSTPVQTFPKSAWRPGDFALHFLAMSNVDKYNRCSYFLQTGEVLWRD